MEYDSAVLDQKIRCCIASIRAELKNTASELRELKRHRHQFTRREAERYQILCRRATVLHVALRFDCLTLGGARNVTDHRWHLYKLRLDGAWFGAVHVPAPDGWRPKLRPNRRVPMQAVRVPNTQPQLMAFTISNSVNWTRLVNDWACFSGSYPFQLDMTIYSFISHHVQMRLEQKAQRRAASEAIRGPHSVLN